MVPVWICLWAAVTSVCGDLLPTNGSSKPLWNATWTDTLKQDLLARYDKFARPAQHTNITEVHFNLIITHVEVDESRSIMVLNAWTTLRWKDEKLRWNASDYGGLKKLTVGDHEIWQPDIVLYNSAVTSLDHYANIHCLVEPDGTVLWVPSSQFSVYCNITLRKWPYDSQTCKFVFGSWLYDGEQIVLKRPRDYLAEQHMDLDEKVQWTIVRVEESDHTKYYTCCSEPYYSIEVTVTVKRLSPSYSTIVFTPAILCVVLMLAMFWLPPAASDKFILSGVTCIICCMFLIYFSHRLSGVGAETPLIVEFYAYSLVLVCVSVIISVLTVSLSRRPRVRPLPTLLTELLRSRLAITVLSLPDYEFYSFHRQDCEELHERHLIDSDRTESVENTGHQDLSTFNKFDNSWTLLAMAIDRLMFLLYLIALSIISYSFYFS